MSAYGTSLYSLRYKTQVAIGAIADKSAGMLSEAKFIG
jgi:hypothetical protein